MKVIHVCTTVLARFFLSLVFLAAAVNKILHWHEMERTLMSLLCEWQSNAGFSENLQDCLATLVPWTPLLLVAATLCELFGGVIASSRNEREMGCVSPFPLSHSDDDSLPSLLVCGRDGPRATDHPFSQEPRHHGRSIDGGFERS